MAARPRTSSGHTTPGQLVERIRTNSALNPLLWLCGVTLPVTVPAAVLAPDPVNLWMLSAALVVVAATLVAYFYFMVSEPNRLQSEDYQIEMQKLLLLGDDRHRGGVVIEGTAMTANTAIQEVRGNG